MNNDDVLAAVAAMEDRRVAAQTAPDAAALEEILDPGLIYTHSNGLRDDKASYIASVKAGAFRYLRIDRSDIRMAAHGDAVMVAGRARIEAMLDGKPLNVQVNYSCAWLRRGGTWRMALWQASPG